LWLLEGFNMKTPSKTLKLSLSVLVVLVVTRHAPIAVAQQTGTFMPVGNMSVPRSFHTATLLPNGKVLIVGGVFAPSGSPQLAAAELYDPVTRTFTPTGNVRTLRSSSSATLLNDGRVLIVGVDSAAGGVLQNSAELYDPATETFTKTGGTATNQIGGWANLLNSGKVLIAGGRIDSPVNGPARIAKPEVYDPATGTFTATGSFATTGGTFYVTGGPDVSAVSLLPDGRVLIAGELTSEVYDPVSGTFSLTSPMTTPCFGPGDQPMYIAGRTATLLKNGKVLLTGGEHEDCGRFANAELYDSVAGVFTPTGSMTRARDNHAALLLGDNTVFVSGGESQDPFGRGGFIFSGTSASAEAFNPDTGSFTVIGDMNARRAGHTATLLLDGTVLLTGGYGYGGIGVYLGNFSSAELYIPPVPVPAPIVTELQFDRTAAVAGSSYSAVVAGSNLTPQTFLDVLFTAPGSTSSLVALNWQTGITSNHDVPFAIARGNWTIKGVRPHQVETDHTGIFFPVSAMITVEDPQFVTPLQFDRTSVVAGFSFSAIMSGSNLTPQTFFDVLFTAPGSAASDVALNWQTGVVSNHDVPAGIVPGTWTINGVRPHRIESDHAGAFLPLSATITVLP
jgi:hypothetical protein